MIFVNGPDECIARKMSSLQLDSEIENWIETPTPNPEVIFN